jgi:hypothetical protein
MKNYTRKSDNYAGKIEYYQAMLANAITDLNIEKIKFYTVKLEYFVNRAAACSVSLNN